ncbi:MAG: DUF4443 domain-containing protein [Candidatus Nezhaarchaeales archaeon]
MSLQRVVNLVETLILSSALGPSPKFDESHIIKLFMSLLKEGAIGRIKLSKILSLGEGSTRTLISKMRKLGLIEETKRGCSLTSLGKEIADILTSKIPLTCEVPINDFGIGGKGVGVLIRGAPARIDVVKLRDEAVKRGAKALITLILIDGKLIMPVLEEDVVSKWPKTARSILETFNPMDGDAVLISIADDYLSAEKGALIAAWNLAFKWT